MKKDTSQNPSLINRAYQLAYETVYAKRILTEAEAHSQYTDVKIKLLDIIGYNDNKIDISSSYNLAVASHIIKNIDPQYVDLIVILATCLKSHDLSKVSVPKKEFMVESKACTGNTICDFQINEVLYDLKCSL